MGPLPLPLGALEVKKLGTEGRLTRKPRSMVRRACPFLV
jgi:hypothetical protein